MNRRRFLAFSAATALAAPALANATPTIKVLKSPTCGCCTAWVTHIRQAGFPVDVQDVDQDQLWEFKTGLQITPEISGCHTATVSDYFVEGHVPASDIERLLAERPAARGLAVPGMPMGSPGMDFSDMRDAFETLLVAADGTTSVFASHA